MSEKIVNVDYESEMAQSYVDYAMSVITERALPDVKDGLKPVQRKVLHAMSGLGKSTSPHRKSARIVGDTMGKFHPHGDSSIYECLVNLSQPWKVPITLIDGHGNFGSVNGDGAAAMRYTEARLTKYIEDVCLKDIKFYEDFFVPNFDGTEKEPTFLPFQIPNILVNGSSGIAVGMTMDIPTHNLCEVIDATIMYLKDNSVSLEELMQVFKGPDFASGGILNATQKELYEIYATGRGKVKVRGKVEIKDIGYGKKSICITEIPQTMVSSGFNTSKFLGRVEELVRNHEIEGVLEVADRSSKDGVCLCIDVKKMPEEDINNIINILYKKAELESTYSININCINERKPEVMGLKRILELYCNFKKELYIIKYNKLLAKQKELYEIKTGLLEAVDVIDLIIEILRGSKKLSDAKKCLTKGDTTNITFKYKGSIENAKNLHFTEKQANEILSMKLQKLIGLEISALKKEISEAEMLIKKYSKVLNNDNNMIKQMIKDMEEIKKEYPSPRRTEIKKCEDIIIKEKEISSCKVVVLFDRFYYAKVIDEAVFEKNEEQIKQEYKSYIKCENVDKIGIFTNLNQMYTFNVSEIIKLQMKKNSNKKNSTINRLSSKGVLIFDICNIDSNESILYIETLKEINNDTLLFVDDKGNGKKVNGTEFNVHRRKIMYSKSGENIIYISSCKNAEYVVLKTKENYFSRINIKDIPLKGKGAACSKVMTINIDDSIDMISVGTLKSNFMYQQNEIPFSKIKLIKLKNKGSRIRV